MVRYQETTPKWLLDEPEQISQLKKDGNQKCHYTFFAKTVEDPCLKNFLVVYKKYKGIAG